MVARYVLGALFLLLAVSACSGQNAPTHRELSGTITDEKARPLDGVKVEIADIRIFTDAKGHYVLDDPPAGEQVLRLSHPWCAGPQDRKVRIKASKTTTFDASLEALPFKLTAKDKATAEAYAKHFDWRKESLQIVVLDGPTERALHNAIFLNNPAYYRDTSAEPKVASKLSIAHLAGAFVAKDGPFAGREVLDVASAKNSIDETPLTPVEVKKFMLFSPALAYLAARDVATGGIVALASLRASVEGQSWETSMIRPQHVGRVFINDKDLWVEIVFEPFVSTIDINDSDGDGFQEFYAKLDPKFISADVIQELRTNYIARKYDPLGMARLLGKTMTSLYSSSLVVVGSRIGTPYQLPNQWGKIEYPWVVLSYHAQRSAKQILLLGQ